MKALFPSREGHFSLRRIRGIYVIRQRACSVTSERCIGELGARCLSTLNREQGSVQQSDNNIKTYICEKYYTTYHGYR